MGLDLPDIYVMQSTAQIKAIIFHLNKGTMVGTLLWIEIEAACLELGVNKSLFKLDYGKWNHLLTDYWLKSTWRFCSEHTITLQGPCPLPEYQRENDECLMETIINIYVNNFTKGEMATIN